MTEPRQYRVTLAYRRDGLPASSDLEAKLNWLRDAGHSIEFITVNTVNEYTIVSIPTYRSTR